MEHVKAAIELLKSTLDDSDGAGPSNSTQPQAVSSNISGKSQLYRGQP